MRTITLFLCTVMVRFTSQLAWAMGYPYVCSDMILDISVRVWFFFFCFFFVFLMTLTFESVDRVKQIALLNVCGPHAVSRRHE